MVAIALRVEMKLRGRFTTYPKKRKPKELCYATAALLVTDRVPEIWVSGLGNAVEKWV